jgi:hypothetical protein
VPVHKHGYWGEKVVDWITPVISGAAGVVGASVGVFGNILNLRNQQKTNRAEQLQKVIEARFMAYNEVLDINGREPILEPGKNRGWRPDLYVLHVRPVLFKHFHLLGKRVRAQVRMIDNRLQLKRWDLVTEEDVPEAMEYMFYFELIALIEEEYHSF